MQEKNSNQNQPSQRDSWSMLQAELGLFSSPVEYEKVSVVNAVDQRDDVSQEDASENGTMLAGETNADVLPSSQESEPVAVNILLPATLESESDAWESPNSNEDDQFGFGGFGDCDIPKNAFAPPKKAKATREAKTIAESPFVELPQEVPEEKSVESEKPFDPLMSDDLPTSLWQPRKPVPVAKTQPVKPSFSETLSNSSSDDIKERKSDFRKQDIEQPPVDDLAKHSFGKNRRDRSQSPQEKTDDRRSDDRMPRETPYRGSDRHRREDSRRSSEPPKYQQRKEVAPHVPQDTRAEKSNEADSSYDEPAWEPKFSKGKGRKPDNPSWQKDDTSFVPDNRDAKEDFDFNTRRERDDANDWTTTEMESEQTDSRESRRNRKHKPSPEPKKTEPEKVVRNAFEAEEAPQRHGRKERESSSRRPTSVQKPAKTPATATPIQKITVCSWDDAVRDIIEKNMQRRPAPKNDHPSGGRRGPRR